VTRSWPPASPLGRRLLAAFAMVALSSIVILTAAALIGTDLGLSAARHAERQQAAGRAAAAAAASYVAAGGWDNADLAPARAIAEGVGATLTVMSADGTVIAGPGAGPGGRGGPSRAHSPAGSGGISADVVAAGHTVGEVRLRFADGGTAGRGIAWGWIAAAAAAALVTALAVSWLVTLRITRPVREVTRAARAIEGGQRTVRARVSAPGELGDLARAFDSMADEVDRAERACRHLAADAAHELRTPLAALAAGLEELRDGLADPSPARLAALHDQALRLGRIVSDLGDLAAAESAGKSMRRADVDLAGLARAVLAASGPQLRAAGLIVHAGLAPGVIVRGDPDRLHQVLGNLLANTARYCRAGDEVTLTVRAEPETAVAEVRDTGPGIPPADLPHVFDRFWRGTAARPVPGSGLGLAVVRELVTAHGGTVQAASPSSGGSVFTVRLPAAREARDQRRPPHAISQAPPA
jgi:two-component system sensor histidine kinase BaeS